MNCLKMVNQKVFNIEQVDKYNIADFIISDANHFAYKLLTNKSDIQFGVKPYERTLLLTGPKSSGKTFLTKIWKMSLMEHAISYAVIEDIESFEQEEELLHLFNAAHENGQYLLMTAKSLPKFALPDLASRINAVNRIFIEAPDDFLIQMFIFKQFSNYSIIVSNEVVKYLTKVLPRELDQISNIVKIINKKSLSQKKKISIPFIKDILLQF